MIRARVEGAVSAEDAGQALMLVTAENTPSAKDLMIGLVVNLPVEPNA